MAPRPSREEFYALRDKRTRAESSGSTEGFSAAVRLDPTTSKTYAAQVTALVLGNILPRFCTDVLFVHDGEVPIHEALRRFPGLPPHAGSLPDALAMSARRLDPFGQFGVAAQVEGEEVRHVIDVAPSMHAGAAFHVSAQGWCTNVGTEFLPNESLLEDLTPNPTGPAMGACLAAADAFRVATSIELASRQRRLSFNLWAEDGEDSPKGPRLSDPVAIGRVVLAGLGGVGGSFAYLSGLARLGGSAALVDHDTAEYSNLNRTLSLEFEHVCGEVKKVMAARPFLEHGGLHAYAYPYRLDEFYRVQERVPGDTDLVLAVANEHGAYRVIQSNYPPTVVHASTSPNWVVTVGHHRPLVDPCIAGVYPDAVAPMKCGEGVAGGSGAAGRMVGSLPFLAPAAATLLLAQVLRIGLGASAPSHVMRSMNLRSENPSLFGFPAPDPDDCMCKSQDAVLHRQFLSEGSDRS